MTPFLLGLFVLGILGWFLGKAMEKNPDADVDLNPWGWAVVVGACLVLLLSLTMAKAADPHDCHDLGEQVGEVVLAATEDADLQQAVAAATEAHCILVDEPPVVIRTQPEKAALAPPPPAQTAKDRWCKQHFGSYRQADGTVLRKRGGGRVPCPFPG